MESRVPVMRQFPASHGRGIRKDGPLPDLRRKFSSCEPEFEDGIVLELARRPVEPRRLLPELT